MLKRVGSCNRCGRCCQGQHLMVSLTEKEKQVIENLVGSSGVSKLKTHRCKHLYYKRRKAVCKIYEGRPDFCRLYPNEPGDLIPGCGFSFKEVNDEDIR